MKLLIFQSLVISVIGTNNSSYYDQVLSVSMLESALSGCRKSEDFKCPRPDITFWLYTRCTQNNPTKLDQYNLYKLKGAPFVKAPVKFIVPGWSVDKDTSALATLRPAYFSQGEYNLIFVEWIELGLEECYYQSVLNTPTIARCVAQFFNALLESFQFPSVHLIGHSVGAHIATLASHEIPNIQRFTVFDPALPLYPSEYLQNPEAQFIDVYHSNCGLYGEILPSGDVDVYLNDGVIQPACSCVNVSCSHSRCVHYYAESIRSPCQMVSFQCDGWEDYFQGKCPPSKLVVVGEGISYNTLGVFLVFTNSQQPFLVDPRAYTDPVWFKSFGLSVANSCLSEPPYSTCGFDIYCVLASVLTY